MATIQSKGIFLTLVAQLDNTYIVDEQGHKRKVRRKDSTMN